MLNWQNWAKENYLLHSEAIEGAGLVLPQLSAEDIPPSSPRADVCLC